MGQLAKLITSISEPRNARIHMDLFILDSE